MIKEKCSTLVGMNKRQKNVHSEIVPTPMSHRGAGSRIRMSIGTILLGALLFLMSGIAHALVISTNTATVDWVDEQGKSYIIAADTAVIQILGLPILSLAKDVRNLRTNESNTDTVQAIRGDTIEFTISIVNSGDTESRNIVIMDSIPVGTEYIAGSASDTLSNDPLNPGQVTFQHIPGGEFDSSDTASVTAIQWKWIYIGGVESYNRRIVKFKVKIRED